MTAIPQYTETGTARRVGVEIEFIGLDVVSSAELVRATYGGAIKAVTDYDIRVATPELGEFRVELDFALLKNMGAERAQASEEPSLISQVSEEILAALAQQVTPCEIVSSPIPFSAVMQLDRLVETLHQAGAQGTDDGLLYAFGVHFNPEIPALDADTILRYLRAFVLLYDWLKAQLQVDLSRRITPYINPFPAAYIRLLLNPAYRPERDDLIRDYLHHNPTRNRALDMLPLFAELAPQLVTAAVNDPLVKPRPTFHYRLSNCRVGDPHWLLSTEWAYWLLLEQLAQQPQRLTELAQDYLILDRQPLQPLSSSWAQHMTQWLPRHGLWPQRNP